jgi:hypothetical protein
MKFEKLQPGMVLYDVHSHKMGNTTMTSIGVWTVRVISVDHEKRKAICSWNGNPPMTYYERGIAKLKEKEPVLIREGFGRYRRATREEIKAMKEHA